LEVAPDAEYLLKDKLGRENRFNVNFGMDIFGIAGSDNLENESLGNVNLDNVNLGNVSFGNDLPGMAALLLAGLPFWASNWEAPLSLRR
jgi:hypothetical protein